jgi:hypothetical protein
MTGDVPEPQGSPQKEKDLRSLVLDEALQLLQKGEQAKVEFKREPPEIAKLAKEIAAIANTDDEGGHYQNDSFRDYGFLIVGVENGRIVGYQTWESLGCPSEEEEKVKDCLVGKLKEYIAPLPGFSVFRFEAPETQVPFWVVLIYPSEEQPHVVLKDGNEVERHTVYVRKGSVIQRASSDDHARFLRKAVSGAVAPLERQIEDTRRRLEGLERRINDAEELMKSLLYKLVDKGLDTLTSSEEATSSQRLSEALGLMNATRSLEEVARSVRLSREDPIERALFGEIDNLREYLGLLPWTLPSGEEKKTLEEVQEKTQPLLQGLGELVWADKEEKYAPIVGEALERLVLASHRPNHVTSWTDVAEAFRLYPLLLTVYHLGILAHFHGRPNYLRLLLTLQLPARTDDENITALLPGLRDRFYPRTYQLFKRLYPGRCMPLSWHLYNLLFVNPGVTKLNLPPRVREGGSLYSSPTDPEGTLATYLEGEFVLGLLALKPQLAIENPRPLLGLYAIISPPLYFPEVLEGPGLFARIKRLVSQPPAHLCQVLELSGKSLEEYLEVLARSISNWWRSGAIMTLGGTCLSASEVYKRLSQGQLGSCAQ